MCMCVSHAAAAEKQKRHPDSRPVWQRQRLTCRRRRRLALIGYHSSLLLAWIYLCLDQHYDIWRLCVCPCRMFCSPLHSGGRMWFLMERCIAGGANAKLVFSQTSGGVPSSSPRRWPEDLQVKNHLAAFWPQGGHACTQMQTNGEICSLGSCSPTFSRLHFHKVASQTRFMWLLHMYAADPIVMCLLNSSL